VRQELRNCAQHEVGLQPRLLLHRWHAASGVPTWTELLLVSRHLRQVHRSRSWQHFIQAFLYAPKHDCLATGRETLMTLMSLHALQENRNQVFATAAPVLCPPQQVCAT
jgi:hypothetical protein